MINEKEESEDTATENLKGIGQIIVGEIESLGGVILGDPATSAEGDFNVQVGTLHHDSSQALESDNKEELKEENSKDEAPDKSEG